MPQATRDLAQRAQRRDDPVCVHQLAGPRGCAQILAAHNQVLVDLQGCAYDTAGFLHQDHATALLPLQDAKRLLVKLAAATAQSEALAPASALLWSNETIGHVALGFPARRHPNRQRARP